MPPFIVCLPSRHSTAPVFAVCCLLRVVRSSPCADVSIFSAMDVADPSYDRVSRPSLPLHLSSPMCLCRAARCCVVWCCCCC